MQTFVSPAFRSCGRELPQGTVGELTDSSSLAHNPEALRQRMEDDGYLFLRNVLDPDSVRAARQSFIEHFSEKEALEPGSNPDDLILKPGSGLGNFQPDFARHNPAVHRVVFGPEIRNFYRSFFGHPIRYFDFIWVRSMGHGQGSSPHCDIVYMGRGTHRLYTAWIPYGNLPFEQGGLMILEKSHLHAARIRNYLEHDVDSYCINEPEKGDGWKRQMGVLSKNPVTLQQRFGGRWLTTEFRMGDLLTFRMDTIHASTDNQTNRIRLSTDTRYQRADEAIDDRWIGEDPVGHGQAGKRGRIC